MNDSKVDNSTVIANNLWNNSVNHESYGNSELYLQHVFEQYKVFVEMADRVSARRNLANTFFLTLHTFLITSVAFLNENGLAGGNVWLYIFPLTAVLSLCYVWYRLLLSYRQLNTAKYKVIGEFEKRLPASPYVSAEWAALGYGEDPKLYRPLTDVEQYVPVVFSLLYIGLFMIFVFSS